MNKHTLIGIIAIVALGVGLYVSTVIAPPSAGNQRTLSTRYLQTYPQPRALSEFELTDHDGEAFTNQNLLGKWSIVFVGYTFCPDICPTTLAELKRIYPQLIEKTGKDALQVILISVDPKRDTTERLNQYINFFHPDFIAASGEHAQLFPLVRSMGMMYAMADSTDNPNYLVDHSASVVVVNPKGQVIGRFKPEHEPGQLSISDAEQILHDLPVLIAGP
ncbi:SCO family protein [Aestuariibacter salexigens]|uniref:SCO family protein n=1 Tax=Aestuariibacter salexigens TaxID=226010 RepID=UPI0004215DB7|nr:SCO family protein [Aestuariibacter salexigens]